MARFLAQRDVGPWQERIAREELTSPAGGLPPRSTTASSVRGGDGAVASSRLNADSLRMLEAQGPAPHLPPHQTLAKGLLQDEPGAFRLRFGRRPAPPRPSRQPPGPALVPNALGMPSAVGATALMADRNGGGAPSSCRAAGQRGSDSATDGDHRGPTSSGEYGRGAATVTGATSSNNRVSATSFVGPRGGSRADIERQLREQARLHEELVGNRGLAQPPSVGGTSQQQHQPRRPPHGRSSAAGAGSSQYGPAMSVGEAAALAAEMEARVRMLEAHIAEERDSRDEVKERLAKLAGLLERDAQQQQQQRAPSSAAKSSATRFAASKRLPKPPVRSSSGSTGGRPPTGARRAPTTLPAEPARQPPTVALSAEPRRRIRPSSSAAGSSDIITSSAAQLSSQHLTW